MKKISSLIVVAGAALLLTAPLVRGQDEDAPITSVDLVRAYEANESQEYTTSAKMSMEGMGDLEMEGKFAWRVTSVLEDGSARIEVEYLSARLNFGGQDVPDILPDKKFEGQHDKHGLPKSIDTASDDPFVFLAPAYFLPGKEVNIGDRFEVKWRADDGNVSINGEGRLMATGMLYEEHVAKVTLDIEATAKDEEPIKYELTTYTNSKTGKLVRAEGKVVMGDGYMKGDIVIAKVRS